MKIKKILSFLPIFLFIIALISMDRFFFKNNKYFSLNLITPKWCYTPQFTSQVPDLSSFFKQPYYYFAKGNQSFVFISEDQKKILKFIRLSKGMRTFCFKRKPIENRPKQTLKNCEDAQAELSLETGIIYAHFSPTNVLKQKVHIIDHLGSSYFLELDSLPFVLQKKVEPFNATFEAFSFDQVRNVIQNIVELYARLYQKQFIDYDPIFEKNLGFIDLQPVIFDFGQIEKCQHLPPKKEYLLQMTNSLRIKLQKDFPELYAYYLETLSRM